MSQNAHHGRGFQTHPYVVLIMIALLILSFVTGCQTDPATDVPTPVRSLDELATAQFMTANAPPPGFRESIAFPLIDANLTTLSAWRSEMFMGFEGVYTGTDRPVTAETNVDIWFNDLGPERRVVIQGEGDLFGQEEDIIIEGVRLGSSTFLVRDGVCLGEAEGDAGVLADSRAGALIGGVNNGVPIGFNGVINGERVWRYEFLPSELNLPQIRFAEGGGIVTMRGELWIAPEHNVAIRYYVTLEMENALILLSSAESSLPVNGQLSIRYDLYDIGQNPNITRPFGC